MFSLSETGITFTQKYTRPYTHTHTPTHSLKRCFTLGNGSTSKSRSLKLGTLRSLTLGRPSRPRLVALWARLTLPGRNTLRKKSHLVHSPSPNDPPFLPLHQADFNYLLVSESYRFTLSCQSDSTFVDSFSLLAHTSPTWMTPPSLHVPGPW